MGEFDTCERKYALHYMWSDFDYFDFPEELKRNCQFHSKLMANEAFAGQVVHDVIDEVFRSKKEGTLLLADPIARAREIAREYIIESEQFLNAFDSGQKPPAIHRQPLFRHFFREGFDGAAKAEFKKTVDTALVNFLDSNLYAEVQSVDPAYWELPPRGVAPWFMDGFVPVYANFDFALRKPGQTILFDWKTGKLSPYAERDVREQLHTYAAFAMQQWQVPAREILLRAVWLTVGKDQLMEIPVDEALLAHMRNSWRERHQELKRRREESRGSVEKLFDLFPMTGIKKKKCRYCGYRFCEGFAQYLSGLNSESTGDPESSDA